MSCSCRQRFLYVYALVSVRNSAVCLVMSIGVRSQDATGAPTRLNVALVQRASNYTRLWITWICSIPYAISVARPNKAAAAGSVVTLRVASLSVISCNDNDDNDDGQPLFEQKWRSKTMSNHVTGLYNENTRMLNPLFFLTVPFFLIKTSHLFYYFYLLPLETVAWIWMRNEQHIIIPNHIVAGAYAGGIIGG